MRDALALRMCGHGKSRCAIKNCDSYPKSHHCVTIAETSACGSFVTCAIFISPWFTYQGVGEILHHGLGTMISRYGYLLYVFWLLVLVSISLSSEIGCLKDIYGSPRPSDCEQLLSSFADERDNQPRLFDEEQLRSPIGFDFPGVENRYPTEIVQLPAYWSLSRCWMREYQELHWLVSRWAGTCNMALMSYAETPDKHVALGVSSWASVMWRGADLINRCMYMHPDLGGSVIIPSCTLPRAISDPHSVDTDKFVSSVYGMNPVLRLFMWESGSYFDALCNEIQNDRTSITPSLRSLMAGASNGTMALNLTLLKQTASPPMSSASIAAELRALRKGVATSWANAPIYKALPTLLNDPVYGLEYLRKTIATWAGLIRSSNFAISLGQKAALSPDSSRDRWQSKLPEKFRRAAPKGKDKRIMLQTFLIFLESTASGRIWRRSSFMISPILPPSIHDSHHE